MINTYTSYQMITRDMARSIDRVEDKPMVKRETDYYLENISNVTSVNEFLDDDRLFKYAMKAFGLAEMDYAKAFMRKVLEEGVSDPQSFANKLTDKRYLEFAKAFNFEEGGSDTTGYVPAQQGAANRYIAAALAAGVEPDDETLLDDTAYYLENVPQAKSIDDLMDDEKLLTFALTAYGMEDRIEDKAFVRELLEGGVEDPDSLANRQTDAKYAEFVSAFNFAANGEDATTMNPSKQPVVDKYLRQTLEEDAGEQNEGVRLALYFERKAPEISSYYEFLSDTALAKVVRTMLGMPESLAQANVDKQVDLIRDRLDLEDLKDPEKLNEMLTRFTSMWEVENPSSPQSTVASVLFGQPAEFGISTDLLLTMAQMKR